MSSATRPRPPRNEGSGPDCQHGVSASNRCVNGHAMRSLPSRAFFRAACLGACFGVAAAHADGFYAGGSLAAPHFGDNINGLSIGNSGVSGKLFGGYQPTPSFGVELGLADLVHINDVNGSIKSHGEYIDGVGLLPLSAS